MFQLAASVIFFAAILYLLLRPVIRGAIYMPTPQNAIEAAIELAKPGPGKKIADIGSGDGRLLIAFAKAGAETEGYEINPLLVLLSRRKIAAAGLQKLARVHWRSLWRENLSKFDTITVFGYPTIMKQLGEKLSREMKPGAEVLSLEYSLPGWDPLEVRRTARSKLILYGKPGNPRVT